MLESAVSIVVVMFMLIAVGYLSQHYGWLGANAQTLLSRLTLRIGVPGLVFSNMLTNYTRDMLLSGAAQLVVPLGVMTITYVLSKWIAGWLKIPKERIGIFRALFTFANCMFVGLPICVAIFGEQATSIVLYYYLVNTIFWWVIGAPAVARDGGSTAQGPLRRLVSPPLIAVAVSLACVLLGVRPPEVLLRTAAFLGNLVTPLSMLFIGCTLCTMVAQGLRWEKGYAMILIGRFLIAPALCLPLCFALGLTGDALGVFFLQSGMPSQTQTCLWAQEHHADAGYAAGAIALTTLLGLVVVPLQTWLLTFLG